MSHNDERWTDSALTYAELGWHLVPFHAIYKDGPVRRCTCGAPECPSHLWDGDPGELATNNLDVIRSWSSPDEGGQPAGHVGVLLGARSQTVALLASRREGGYDELAKWEEAHGELPWTLSMTRGSKAKTIYFFHWPEETPREVITLGPGLRLLGSGYVQRLPDSTVPDSTVSYGFSWEVHPGRDRPAVLPRFTPGFRSALRPSVEEQIYGVRSPAASGVV